MVVHTTRQQSVNVYTSSFAAFRYLVTLSQPSVNVYTRPAPDAWAAAREVMKRNPTILDVAEAAGVSIATVSRALNGGKVSQRAKRAVEQAIAALGYRPNTLARGLVTGKSGVVGVLIPDVAGPLYAQMARGIEDVLDEHGMSFMMVTGNRDPEAERASIELLLNRRVDALILIGSGLQHEPLEKLLRGGPPVVLMEREGSAENFTTISLANSEGAERATRYLIARGHRRIAHVAGIRRAGERRLKGYLKTMREAGLTPGPILQGDFSEESGMALADALLADAEVTAVFCANDRMAVGLYRALNLRQRSIPEDLSVVGFDDLPWGAYLNPPLTTVRQPARQMGQLAAREVLTALAGGNQAERLTVPAELVERASVKDLSKGGDVRFTGT